MTVKLICAPCGTGYHFDCAPPMPDVPCACKEAGHSLGVPSIVATLTQERDAALAAMAQMRAALVTAQAVIWSGKLVPTVDLEMIRACVASGGGAGMLEDVRELLAAVPTEAVSEAWQWRESRKRLLEAAARVRVRIGDG